MLAPTPAPLGIIIPAPPKGVWVIDVDIGRIFSTRARP